MRKIYIRNIFITLIFLITLTSAITYSTGPGGGYSNAPGESNCTTSGCHSGTLITSGNANLNKILLNPHFTNGGYMPDSTYSMELTFKQSGIGRFGFEITCLNSSTSLMEGTFTAGNSRVQKATATISGKSRNYLEHTYTGSSGVATDSTRWVLTWKAPPADDGKIKFYVVINAANNNGLETGDIIYAKTFEFSCGANFPVANATSNDTITCTNYKAAFKGTGTNSPTSYSWKFTGATPSTSTQQNPTVTFTTPGKQYAILAVNNSSGPSRPDTVKVTVNASPTATILNGTSATICSGDSLLLTANTGANYSYKWSPSGKTSKSVYAKDTGLYTVTTKSVVNGCTTTSASFRLNLYPKPTISISRTSLKDTFCGSCTDVFTATGNNMDSIFWYVNGKLYSRTKGLSTSITVSQDAIIYAVATSVNKCKSASSNSFNVKIVPRLTPFNFVISKTTSNINIRWTQPSGADSIRYSVNGSQYMKPTTDTSLILAGLTPNAPYNFNFRTYQNTFCKTADTPVSIRTNACSNLAYTVFADSRVCRGNDLKCVVKNLYADKYSISFNKGPFGTDTIYTFKPTVSDSISIVLKDSMNLSCAAIQERVGYKVDTLPLETGYTASITSCDSQFLYQLSPQYQHCEFYKNNVLLSSGASNSFLFTGLVSGDQLKGSGTINSCSRTFTSTFNINTAYSADFSYSRNWKTYTFKAKDTQSNTYHWYINNVLKGNTKTLTEDLWNYKGTSIDVSLAISDLTGCTDSISKAVAVPDLSGVQALSLFSIRIYPNPFGEVLNVETDLEAYDLEMTDIAGRSIAVDVQGNTIYTGTLGSGLYFVRLIQDGKVVYQGKVMKY